MQAMNRAQRVRVRKHETEPDLSKLETASTTSNDTTPLKRIKTSEDSDGEHPMIELPASDIELVFRPLPTDNQNIDTLQTRFIKTTANASGKIYIIIIKYKWSFSELQIVVTFEPLNRF